MNGKHLQEGPYKSQRPTSTGSRVVRLSGTMGQASRIMLECDGVELLAFLSSVIAMGYCISVTGTSDGGAISLTVFDGAIRWKSYARCADELLSCYRDLLGAIRGEE